jgi:hypothetical protein
MNEQIPQRTLRQKLWDEQRLAVKNAPEPEAGAEPAVEPPTIVDLAREYHQSVVELAIVQSALANAVDRFRLAGEAFGFLPEYESRSDALCEFIRVQAQNAQADHLLRIARRKALSEPEPLPEPAPEPAS